MSLTPVIEVDEFRNSPAETQYNFARINAFRLIALELPSVDFYCQMVTLPEARLGEGGTYDNPFNSLPLTGTSITYGEFPVTFIVDEKFANYRAIYNWMTGIGFPQNNEQFSELLRKKQPILANPRAVESATRSQIDLLMLDSMNNPIITYSFHDAFPVSLAGLPFDITITDTKYFTVMAGFKFSYYTVSV